MEEQKIKEAVQHPAHYNQYDVEVLTMMERIWGKEEVKTFCKLNAFKYRMRAGYKDDVETDLQKEKFYLEYLEELRNERVGGQEVWAAYSNPVSLDAIIKLDAIKKAFESSHEAETIVNRIYDVIWGEK